MTSLTLGTEPFLMLRARSLAHPRELAVLVGCDKGDGRALVSCPSRAADAVHVGLRVLGQGPVHDVRQAFHVDAAGGHVGGHEDARLARSGTVAMTRSRCSCA